MDAHENAMPESDPNAPTAQVPTAGPTRPATAPGGQAPAPLDADALAAVARQLQPLPITDDLVDWVGFLRRQWLLMAVVWVAMMVIAVVALYLWPRQYTSSAKFLVKNSREELVVGPSADVSTAFRTQSMETMLNTELELLRSRDILTRVVSELKLAQPLIDSGQEPAMATELAVRGLSGQLESGAIRKTNIVQVAYTGPDPVQTAAIVQHLADAYLAAHLVIHSTPGTYEMFQRQAQEARVDLGRAEEELAALARTSNLVNLDTQKQDALKTVHDMETELAAVKTEIRAQSTRARIAELHMSRTPERVPTQVRNMPNQSSVERLHTMLAELRNKRTEMLTKFRPNDRMVVELDTQIADTTKALTQAQTMSANEESTDINPAWQQLEAERTKAQLQLAGLESKAAALEHELGEERARTLAIAEAGPKYEAVVRKVDAAKSRYELLVKKQEEARIDEVLDQQRISNVVLAQAPVVSYVPSKPNVRLGLVAGAILAAFAALAVALLREMFGFGMTKKRPPVDVTVLGITPATAELP